MDKSLVMASEENTAGLEEAKSDLKKARRNLKKAVRDCKAAQGGGDHEAAEETAKRLVSCLYAVSDLQRTSLDKFARKFEAGDEKTRLSMLKSHGDVSKGVVLVLLGPFIFVAVVVRGVGLTLRGVKNMVTGGLFKSAPEGVCGICFGRNDRNECSHFNRLIEEYGRGIGPAKGREKLRAQVVRRELDQTWLRIILSACEELQSISNLAVTVYQTRTTYTLCECHHISSDVRLASVQPLKIVDVCLSGE